VHFHLPKPLHGWREFAGEVGIIVLGVLIALGAEQAVESAHLRSEMKELRSSMHDELSDDRGRWEIMHSQRACMEKALAQLSAWSTSAPPEAKPPIGAYSPIFFNAHVSSWEMARNSPGMTALSLEERDQLADLYQVLEYAQEDDRQVYADWGNAFLLAAAGGAENRGALPLAIMKARKSVDQLMADYVSLTPRFAALHIAPTYHGARLSSTSMRGCAPLPSR
jgi:hypothetical protein